MDSFVIDDKEIQCFCFDSLPNKNRTGLRPAPNLKSSVKGKQKTRPIVKSVQQKFNQLDGSRTKKSLKRDKPKTPQREIFVNDSQQGSVKLVLPDLKKETERLYPQVPVHWSHNPPYENTIPARCVAKLQTQTRNERRAPHFRNTNCQVSIEPIKFDNPHPTFSQTMRSTKYSEMKSPKITFTANLSNQINNSNDVKCNQIKEQKRQQKVQVKCHKSISLKEQLQEQKKIYPKEIQSVVDENQIDEDEFSQVEWGWLSSNEERQKQEHRLETLNTMASNIKNSSIKNSLLGAYESQLTKP